MTTAGAGDPGPRSVPSSEAPARRRVRWLDGGLWVDMVLFALLVALAAPNRLHATRGDLWLDEADYAFAAVRGYAANCWDAAPSGAPSLTLVRLRHYHPPFTAHVLGLGLRRGSSDLDVRLPAVVAGSLAVGLVYLCGIALLRRGVSGQEERGGPQRSMAGVRLAAAGAALIVVVTPPCVRAASHALPWAFITMWLLLVLWAAAEWCDTCRTVWLGVLGAALGGLFATSEVFFVAAVGGVAGMPALIAAGRREQIGWKAGAAGAVACAAMFAAVAYALWPNGLRGGAVTMLQHYVDMAETTFPVELADLRYKHAPKWAYAFWYGRIYAPHTLCYALGAVAAIVLAASRRLSGGGWVLLTLTVALLGAAHRAHIIGPEYLAHVLPLLTLLTALFFGALLEISPAGSAAVVGACVAITALHLPPQALNGMDRAGRQVRWSRAITAVASRWRPGDRMLAGQFGTVGRWYLLHVAMAPGAVEKSVQILPARGTALPAAALHSILAGQYRFLAVGSSLQAYPDVNQQLEQCIAGWPVVWESPEEKGARSRLTIREAPHRPGG